MKTRMIKFMSLHLSNLPERRWILFGNGLGVLKRWRNKTGPDMYVCMTVLHVLRQCMHACMCARHWPIQLSGKKAAPPAHGWAAVWETPAPHMTSTHTSKVHWKSAPMLELMALPNIGLCPPHTFLWIMEKNRNHFNGTLAMGAVDEQIHRMYGRQQTTTTQSSM